MATVSNEWTDDYHGVKGRIFGTGTNFLFFPAAGNRWYVDGKLVNVGTLGGYWSRTPNGSSGFSLIYYMRFSSGGPVNTTSSQDRKYGYSIRCVIDPIR